MSKDYEKKALEYFSNGYNCSESSLLIGCDILGIKDPIIPRVATCFGGGINGCGNICGLYTGAMMSIGIKYGRDTHIESRETANKIGREFHDFWINNIGKLNCCDLLDIDYPEELIEISDKKSYGTDNCCKPMCTKITKWLVNKL
ncbi:MAG: C-GCAxxG-C-C family protein [Firmicutes bacterium]|nr:C-GCAxxG-C-C family protein [Bacillota bacterium]